MASIIWRMRASMRRSAAGVPGRLEDGVHDRAQAAQDHGAELGMLKDEVVEAVRGFALLGEL
jgi:hypothetical protein